MSALLIIGSTLVGAGVGGAVGVWSGFGQDDLQIAAGMNGIAGVIVGGFAGCVIGAVLFA